MWKQVQSLTSMPAKLTLCQGLLTSLCMLCRKIGKFYHLNQTVHNPSQLDRNITAEDEEVCRLWPWRA